MAVDLSKIKKVAIYLRKSRGDEEDAVAKHRQRLIEYAEKNGWEYQIENENVMSGESLSGREVILELLQKVENKEYDGVLVVQWDRLSRGGTDDFSNISKVFQYSKTAIITPERAYDLNDNADLTLLGLQAVMSNTEYRLIKNRLISGKKDGVKMGRLTNGNPPYPYIKVRNVVHDDKGRIKVDFEILVDKDKNEVYQRIKKMYLSGMNTEKIAFQLNKEGILSPNGKTTWSSTAVNRLLKHEFHTGKIIYGKNEWTKKPLSGKLEVRQRDETLWNIGIGNHEILKTEEEHQKIMSLMAIRQKIPRKSRAGTFPTSGLLICKKCGYHMIYSIGRVEARTGKLYNYTKCYYKDILGNRCSQKGVKMNEDFYDALYNTIIKSYVKADKIKKIAENKEEKSKREKQIKDKKDKLTKEEDALKRTRVLLEEGVYGIDDFLDAKKRREPLILKLKQEIAELENANEYTHNSKDIEKLIEDFKQNWYKVSTAEEQNRLLKVW